MPVQPTTSYLPGHDARHAARVGRDLIALGAVDDVLLADLPTEALRAKAVAMLTRSTARPPAEKPPLPPTLAEEEPAADDRTNAELLAGYAAILVELRRRGVIRTNNAPAGDYAEWLVARAVGGQVVTNAAEKSYDVVMPDGKRVQVKARVVSVPVRRGQLQASVFRRFDFELAALVLLRDTDYAVHRAVLTPRHVVEAAATRVEHVNGWRLMMTSAVLDHQETIDITAATRQAALES